MKELAYVIAAFMVGFLIGKWSAEKRANAMLAAATKRIDNALNILKSKSNERDTSTSTRSDFR